MPCNYFGKIIPGGDRASCVAGGGTWVSEPSLMTDPTTGQGLPMVGTTEQPVENLTSYMIPGAGGVAKGVTKAAPLAKKTVQSLFTKPGVVKKPVPILRKTTSETTKKAGTLMKPVPKKGQQMATKKVDAQGRVLSVPKASATALGAKGLYDMTVSPNPYEGQTGPITDKKVVQPINGTKPTGKPVDKSNLFTGNKEAEKNIPDNKNEVESGLSGLWSNMQKPGYWSNKVEGGAGDWDNRLFRLGEMMAYMGTPLSKRGKNPAARWTAANTEQSKIKAAIEKARLEAGKGETGKALTFPQFTGNFDKALTTFAEGTWNPFDNYSEEQMANVRLKAWKVHEKNPTSTIEDILNALLAEGQI